MAEAGRTGRRHSVWRRMFTARVPRERNGPGDRLHGKKTGQRRRKKVVPSGASIGREHGISVENISSCRWSTGGAQAGHGVDAWSGWEARVHDQSPGTGPE